MAAAGPSVHLCRRGCSACCFGLFDISPADAEPVAGAIDRLDLQARTVVLAGAADQVSQYAAVAPAWTDPWDVDEIGDEVFDAVSDALAAVPYPRIERGRQLPELR